MLGATLLFVVATAIYSLIAFENGVLSPQVAQALTTPAYVYLLSIGLAMVIFLVGLFQYLRKRADILKAKGKILLSPGSLVPYLLSQTRYRVVLGTAAVAYGSLYGLLTSVVVFRPDLDFRSLPGLAIPSIQPDQLVGTPLYVPEVTVFLTDHLGLILIPLTILMLVAVSVLVGINLALTVFAYDNRTKGAGISWSGQLGAAIGLFTGCPTCAGLYFFSVIGGSGAASVAITLGYFQPVFVLLGIPVLLITPYLTSRALTKVFREGCVIVPQSGYHRP